MFTSDLAESKQDKVSLYDVDPDAVESLIDYAYSNKVLSLIDYTYSKKVLFFVDYAYSNKVLFFLLELGLLIALT